MQVLHPAFTVEEFTVGQTVAPNASLSTTVVRFHPNRTTDDMFSTELVRPSAFPLSPASLRVELVFTLGITLVELLATPCVYANVSEGACVAGVGNQWVVSEGAPTRVSWQTALPAVFLIFTFTAAAHCHRGC